MMSSRLLGRVCGPIWLRFGAVTLVGWAYWSGCGKPPHRVPDSAAVGNHPTAGSGSATGAKGDDRMLDRGPSTHHSAEPLADPLAESLPLSTREEIAFVPNGTLWERAQQLYQDARNAGTTSAQNAADWVAEAYTQSISGTKQMADSATDWIAQAYRDAVADGETQAKSAADWILDDLGNIGTWEYKVVRMGLTMPSELEKTLNELGNGRWECFSVRVDQDSQVLYCKRPHRSYLRQLPAQDLLRILPQLNASP